MRKPRTTTRRAPKQSSTPRRALRIYTWNPTTRVERDLITKRVPFAGDVGGLLRIAAQLAGYDPWGATLGIGADPFLSLDFCTDEHGTQTRGNVALQPSDGPLVQDYLMRRGAKMAGIVVWAAPEHDDDGGEELPVPTAAMAAFENLPTEHAVRQ